VEQQRFSRRQVERSFRKFNNIVDDLFQATFETWGDTFTHLVTHCEQDPVMRVVIEPLRSNKNVDASTWYDDALASGCGMLGSCRYELPYDDDDKTALLYQVFVLFNNENMNINHFCIEFYGSTDPQDSVDKFNRELVRKFTREVSCRLEEIMEDIGDQQEVSREAMLVFHHHDYSTNIHGNIQGSNVATGGATISDSTASYTDNEELAAALKSLRPLIQDISEGQRETVDTALQLLVRATHDSSVSKEEVAEATRTIAASSPSVTARLREIAGKIGISLVSSSIFQGIKMALGL
jgi:hypothetical protein